VPVPIALSTLWLPIICTVDHNHRLLSWPPPIQRCPVTTWRRASCLATADGRR